MIRFLARAGGLTRGSTRGPGGPKNVETQQWIELKSCALFPSHIFSSLGKFETRLIKLPPSLWHLPPQVDTNLQLFTRYIPFLLNQIKSHSLLFWYFCFFFSRGPHFIDLRWAKSEAPIRVLMVSHPNGWAEDTLFSLFDYFHRLYIRHGSWEIQCNRGWTFKVAVNRMFKYCL